MIIEYLNDYWEGKKEGEVGHMYNQLGCLTSPSKWDSWSLFWLLQDYNMIIARIVHDYWWFLWLLMILVIIDDSCDYSASIIWFLRLFRIIHDY